MNLYEPFYSETCLLEVRSTQNTSKYREHSHLLFLCECPGESASNRDRHLPTSFLSLNSVR